MANILSLAPMRGIPRVDAPVSIVDRIAHLGAVVLILFLASLYLLVFTAEGGLGDNVHESMESRFSRLGVPSFNCDEGGNATLSGVRNCFDHRGFRIVTSKGYRVFSLRYAKPLFVFGLEGGLTYGNQRIPDTLQRSELDSFMRYLAAK